MDVIKSLSCNIKTSFKLSFFRILNQVLRWYSGILIHYIGVALLISTQVKLVHIASSSTRSIKTGMFRTWHLYDNSGSEKRISINFWDHILVCMFTCY